MWKNIKRYIGISLALILTLSLSSCANKKDPILPQAKDIEEIEVTVNTSQAGIKIREQDKISGLITSINENTESTAKESISDQPTNINDYIVIKFHHKNAKENPNIAYLYTDKGACYFEQAYSGIWKLKKEIFDNISNKLAK